VDNVYQSSDEVRDSWNRVGDESSWLPTLLEAVDEEGVECGVVLTQPPQET
jgi:hypothetical protein